jgi:hypothetical protein
MHLRREANVMPRLGLAKGAGMLVLAIWLILTGLFALFDFSFSNRDTVMGLLALVAGILVLLGK